MSPNSSGVPGRTLGSACEREQAVVPLAAGTGADGSYDAGPMAGGAAGDSAAAVDET